MRARDRGSVGGALRVVSGSGDGGAKASPASAGNGTAERGQHEQARDDAAQARVDAVVAEIDKAAAAITHAIAARDATLPSAPRIPITVPVRTASCPGLKLVSPNRVRGTTRGAALSEAARHKRLRDIGLWQTKGSLTGPMLDSLKTDMGVANITITRVAPKHFDDDNFISSCKWLRDGIAEAFGVADNHPNIKFWYEQIHGKPREYRVDIEYRITRK